jgi:hypothetical protein
MANTYTPKLNLAKPANGDVDWHIPVNENWDKIDSELGTLSENIEVGESEITFDKKVVANEVVVNEINVDNITSTNVMLIPSGIKRKEYSTTGSPGTFGTFTVPSQYVTGSCLGFKGSGSLSGSYSVYPMLILSIKVNTVLVKSYSTRVNEQGYGSFNFDDYISVKGNDVVSVELSVLYGSYYSASCSITFYGDDTFPFTVPHPTWS